MVSRVVGACAALLLLAGCGIGGSDDGKCPKPIHYDLATEKKIQKALEALPPDNILHDAMADYEQERDDLRFCR